jgi:hypothetical protein
MGCQGADPRKHQETVLWCGHTEEGRSHTDHGDGLGIAGSLGRLEPLHHGVARAGFDGEVSPVGGAAWASERHAWMIEGALYGVFSRCVRKA